MKWNNKVVNEYLLITYWNQIWWTYSRIFYKFYWTSTIINCKRYSDFKTIYLHYHAGGKFLPVLLCHKMNRKMNDYNFSGLSST